MVVEYRRQRMATVKDFAPNKIKGRVFNYNLRGKVLL